MRKSAELSDLILEKMRLGELNADQVRAVGDRGAEPEVQARLRRLDREDETFFGVHPSDRHVPEILRRARGSRPVWPQLVAAAALLVLVPAAVVMTRTVERVPFENRVDRVKGIRPYLNLYRKTGDTIEHLENGAAGKKGDLIQMSYISGDAKFGVVLSVDRAGVVSWHLPSAQGQAVELRGGAEVVLPEAFELDGSTGFEKFVFLTSDRGFTAEQALASLERQSDEQGSIRKFTLLLKK